MRNSVTCFAYTAFQHRIDAESFAYLSRFSTCSRTLNENADVRAATFNSSIFDRPFRWYSCQAVEIFVLLVGADVAKGSTAIGWFLKLQCRTARPEKARGSPYQPCAALDQVLSKFGIKPGTELLAGLAAKSGRSLDSSPKGAFARSRSPADRIQQPALPAAKMYPGVDFERDLAALVILTIGIVEGGR